MENDESKKGRRDFLKGSLAAGAAGLLAGIGAVTPGIGAAAGGKGGEGAAPGESPGRARPIF